VREPSTYDTACLLNSGSTTLHISVNLEVLSLKVKIRKTDNFPYFALYKTIFKNLRT